MKNIFAGVVLAAPVSFGYTRYSEHGVPWFAGNALAEMLRLSGLEKSAVDGLAIASFSLSPDTPASLAEYFGLELRLLEALPFGGASGVIAARRAARAVQAGDVEVMACIGADTSKPNTFSQLVANFSTATMDASYPYAAAGPNLPFALLTQSYMDRYGARREDFGRICVAQRYNANHCDHALFAHKPLDLEAYLTARSVVDPLHLFDCVMPCAGADSFLVMREERARALNIPYVYINSAFEAFNAFSNDPVQLRSGWSRYGVALYEQAQIKPDAIDIIETYDDYPVIVMLQLEGMQLCGEGQAARYLRDHELRFDSDGPVHNTSGGQLSVGQAGAAGGFLGIVEAIRQLTHSAGRNQVREADSALVTGFGMINYDRGLCSSAAILSTGHD
ncbi:MAG: acetyl-CoA acetyltransferase [Gammaproteobacteria bacterium]|jgi:acetyl-CoA acetyltransferase